MINNKLLINGKKIVIRNDEMLSNWALVTYIIYMCVKFILYVTNSKINISNFSPKLILIIAIFIASLTLLYGIYLNVVSKNNIICYIIMTFLLKIIPLYTVRNDRINNNVIIFTLIIIIIYLLYLDINEASFFTIYLAMAKNHPTTLGIICKNLFYRIKSVITSWYM